MTRRSSPTISITHQAVRGRVFTLVQVFEFTADLEGPITFTVELWRHAHQRTLFKARIWEAELFRLRPTFPQSKGKPLHISDDEVRVERSVPQFGFNHESFKARSARHAVTRLTLGLEHFLAHVTAQPAERSVRKRAT